MTKRAEARSKGSARVQIGNRSTTCVMLAAALLSVTTSIEAENLERVTLTGGIPDKALPVGEDFLLAGDAARSVTEAYAVFARVSWPLLGAGSADATICNQLADDLTNAAEPAATAEAGKPPNPTVLPTPGHHDHLNEIWVKSSHTEPALVTAPWHRSAEADSSYQVLVPASAFFREGASYCLFVLKRTKDEQQEAIAYRNTLAVYAATFATCADATCQKKAFSKLTSDLDEALEGVRPASETEAAWKAIRMRLVDAAPKLAQHPRQIRAILGTWKNQVPPQDGPDGSLEDTTSPRGFVLAELLARAGELSREAGNYLTADGTQVTQLGLTAGFDKFVYRGVKSDPAGKSSPTPVHGDLAVPAARLLLPDSTISLEAAWKFAQGYLKVDGEYQRIWELSTKYVPSADTSSLAKGIPPPQIAELEKLKVAFAEFEALFERIDAVKPGASSFTDKLFTMLKALADASKPTAATLRSLLAHLGTDFVEYEAAARDWNDAPSVVHKKIILGWTSPDAVSISSRAGLTQKRWFDTYVTPVVGRVTVFSRTANYSEWYVGLQIFGWANPVNEPMWINGFDLDIRRVPALEVAVIPNTGRFGPRDRFAGFNGTGTPALMIGLGFQLLPYVSLSAGGIWLTRKETRIAAEEPSGSFNFYLALSVQANLPGLVRTMIASPGTETHTE